MNFKKTTKRYTIQDLFNNLQKVWDLKKEQPIIKDMDVYPSEICFKTYFNRFGSWKKAIEEFVKYKNKGILLQEKNIYSNNKRKSLNNSLRYIVMKRDNFKCCLCGKSPATNVLTILEVDHILPVVKGGLNNLDNLQTICKSCNIGKFDK
jgi:hypothetical protein